LLTAAQPFVPLLTRYGYQTVAVYGNPGQMAARTEIDRCSGPPPARSTGPGSRGWAV